MRYSPFVNKGQQSFAQPAKDIIDIDTHFKNFIPSVSSQQKVGFWDWHLFSDTVIYSGQFEEIAGYMPGTIPVGNGNYNALVYNMDRDHWETAIQSVLSGQANTFETEYRMVRKDGSLVWVSDKASVADRDAWGRPTRMVGSISVIEHKDHTWTLLHSGLKPEYVSNLTGLGIWEWDIQSDHLSFGDGIYHLLGYHPQEMDGPFIRLHSIIHPDDMDDFVNRVQENLYNGQGAFVVEFRAFHKDKRCIWLLCIANVVAWDAQQKPRRMLGAIVNIDTLVSAKERIKDTLNASRQQCEDLRAEVENTIKVLSETNRTSEALFETSPSICLVFDDSFKVVDCNHTAVDFFGYSSKEVLLSLINEDTQKHLFATHIGVNFKEQLELAVREGRCQFESWTSAQGRCIPMSVTMRRIPYKDRFAIATYQSDMQLVKKAQRDLLHRDRLLGATTKAATLLLAGNTPDDFLKTVRLALQTLGESVNVDRAYFWRNITVDGQLCCYELCEWSRGKPSEAPYLRSNPVSYDSLVPDWRNFVVRNASINTPVRYINTTILKHRGLCDVQSILLIPVLLHGEFWGFIGFDDCRQERVFSSMEEDILKSGGMLIASAVQRNEMTERLINAKDQALDSTRAKSEFLSRMSHEIRTPMNAIIGMTAIAQKSQEPEKVHSCLDQIDKASKQLLCIINDVLDMSKIESNKFELDCTEFDFIRMLKSVVDLMQVKMDEKHQNFQLNLQTPLHHFVIGDELRFSQVMINLLGNAIKFTPEYGDISITLRSELRSGNTIALHVEVRDSGIGIPPDQQQKLFSTFEQLDGGINRQYGGTGLGLAICKRIINLMGGNIWIESEVSEGSVFVFEVEAALGSSIPAVPTEENMLPVDPIFFGAVPLRYNWKGRTILLAEDIEINREIAVSLLEETGAVIESAQDGIEALEMFEAHSTRYDLILMDVQMPGMDGLAATRKIRESGLGNAWTIPIIAMTANAFNEDIMVCLEAGMNAHIPKPINAEYFYNTLEQFLPSK